MTSRMIKFCILYIESQNARQSCLDAGYSKSYSNTKSSQLLKHKEVQERIKYLEDEFYSREFKKLALKSIKKLDNILSSSEIESVQLNASKFVLSQAGISDKEVSATQTIQIKIKMPSDDI